MESEIKGLAKGLIEEIIKADMQNNEPVMWAIVDTESIVLLNQ